MNTLLLDRTTWDLVLDSAGNIALASDPYSVAQDVASACRTFLGEVYYDTRQGLPYWTQILGQNPPLSLVRALYARAAATVPGCNNPVALIDYDRQVRRYTGQIQFTDSNGQVRVATV